MADRESSPFSPFDFTRIDDGDDALFYLLPRLVVHIDYQAIAAIAGLFKEVIPPDSTVLDLMSSWRSHWPKGHPKARLVGLGLNPTEMRENPDLDDFVVHDVNLDPRLPFEDGAFDAAVITVSVQYLTKPVDVFRDVHRLLKPGGVFLVIFSNRMFFTKAVNIWRTSGDGFRMDLVSAYLEHADDYGEPQRMYLNPDRGHDEDPVYVVIARKPPAERG